MKLFYLQKSKQRNNSNKPTMEEYQQFDRFLASLLERNYEPVTGKTIAEAYPNAGALWEEEMNTLPEKPPVLKYRQVEEKEDLDNSNTQVQKGPNIPLGRAFLGEKYGHANTDGLMTMVLYGQVMVENMIGKSLLSGILTMDTFVAINESTGAPIEFAYTFTNTTLRDVELELDFADSKGVVSIRTDTKLECSSLLRVTIKAKETRLCACLKPQKKKSAFAWENESDNEEEEDEEGSSSRRKKKSDQQISATVKVKWLWSREVSFQLLNENCSAVYNARGETNYEKYFYGNSNENIFEWIIKQETAAKIDRVSPRITLGRMMAYLRQDALQHAIRVLEGYENSGVTGTRIISEGLKTSLKQTYGAHNQSLFTAVNAGMNLQIKELLVGDVTTYGPEHLHVSVQKRLDYRNLEPYGPRLQNATNPIYGRDPRCYYQYPPGWPRTLPNVARMPIYGRNWQSYLNGTTALHLACINNNLAVVHTLLHYGWKLDVCDYQGKTAVEAAQFSKHYDLYHYLFKYHWRHAISVELPISAVIKMMREGRTAHQKTQEASNATQDVATSMDNQGILGMNQLIEFHEATMETSKEAKEQANQVLLLAESVNGKGALDDINSENDNEDEDEDGETQSNKQMGKKEGLEKEEDEEEDEEEEEEEGDGNDIKMDDTKDNNDSGNENENGTATEAAMAEVAAKAELDAAAAIVEAARIEAAKTIIDADNYDMLNLWHVLYAGDADNATAAIRLGYKLRYLTNVGWQAISSSEIFIHYGIHNKTWTDGGGISLIHAIVNQPYDFPAPKSKPCLLLLLDEGYPGDAVDMYGRTPADYAKKYNHSAMSGVLNALVRKTVVVNKNENGSGSDSDDSSDEEVNEKKEPEIVFPKEWVYTRPATVSENQILFGMCSGAHGNSANNIVREAVLGGKALFTHGTGQNPIVGCRKRNGEQYPVRYDINWNTRFEPTLNDDDLPEINGLRWNCLHMASFAGEIEIVALLLAAGWSPTVATARGHTAVDLARIMGHEALHYAMEQVADGEYDVMVRDTCLFYASLREYACPKLIEYAQESLDMAEAATNAASRVNVKYLEVKKEEERKLAELEAAEGKKKKKRKKKKRQKKLKSPKTTNKKTFNATNETNEDTKKNSKYNRDSNQKTFFRGRLNFRTDVLPSKVLDTWACYCTTINPVCATICKFCYRSRKEQEIKMQKDKEYQQQFNHKENNTTLQKSYGLFEPFTMTLEEERLVVVEKREKIVRLMGKKSLYKKMKNVIKSSLKKFAFLPNIYADSFIFAHMFDIVHDPNSEMTLIDQINVWLGNGSKSIEEVEEEMLHVNNYNDALISQIHLFGLETEQIQVEKNMKTYECEWLRDPEWGIPREEEEEEKEEEKKEGEVKEEMEGKDEVGAEEEEDVGEKEGEVEQ